MGGDMRLKRLEIENFRCFREAFSVEFDDLTAIIGQNDVGKSTIMDALSIFFEQSKIDRDDGCISGNRGQVRITCEFDDLPDSVVVDTDFPTELGTEYLLNGQARFQVRKTYDTSLATPKLTSIEAIARHPTAEGVHDLLELKRQELVTRAGTLGVDLDGINRQANAPIRAAIWASVVDLQLAERAISLDKEGGKQLWTALAPSLPAFALFKSDRASTDQDAEAQDPLKAAIREALGEIEPQLAKIQEHVLAEVRKIAEATVAKIREMDPSVAATLSPVVTAKKWDTLFQTSITGDEGIPINKRGSGIKRLVLLNFFRAKAEKSAAEKKAGSIIYAIEEPETSQHPRNQRMLMSALTDLSAAEGKQIIITTHTPMLARALPDTSLRFIERQDDNSRRMLNGGAETNTRISKSLGVLPDHSVRLFLGVEGKHDIAFLKGISRILRNAGQNVPDFDALEISGELIFFPFGGSNLALWTSRLQPLNRPEYHIYDRDNQPPLPPKYEEFVQRVNARPDCAAVVTSKKEMENFLHPDAVTEAYGANGIQIRLGGMFADFDDVPALVAQEVHRATAQTAWPADPDIRAKKESRAKGMLNSFGVARMTLARLQQVDPDGEILGWMNAINQRLA